MTTVESIIQEFLDRGYSVDDLRGLAESKSGEIGARLLSVLDGMRDGGGADPVEAAADESGPYETTAYPVPMTEEDMVFFVAGDEEDMSVGDGEGGDATSGTLTEDESVADIVIGETAGSGLVGAEDLEMSGLASANRVLPDSETANAVLAASGVLNLQLKKSGILHSGLGGDAVGADGGGTGVIAAEAAREQSGLLTRLWSRVSPKADSAADSQDASSEDSGIADVSGSALYFEAVAEESSIAIAEASEVLAAAALTGAETGDGLSGEPPRNFSASGESSGCGLNSDIRADYLPGSVSDIYEDNGDGNVDSDKGDGAMEMERTPETVEEARQALIEAQRMLSSGMDPVESVSSPDDSGGAALESEPDAVQDVHPVHTVHTVHEALQPVHVEPPVVCGDESNESGESGMAEAGVEAEVPGTGKTRGGGKRKRNRGRKKKAAKQTDDTASGMPEIVLTCSEGTETMVPERAAKDDAVQKNMDVAHAGDTSVLDSAAGESAKRYLPSVLSGESGIESADALEEVKDDESRARAGSAMSLLTPLDLLAEDSDAADMFGFVSAEEEKTDDTHNANNIDETDCVDNTEVSLKSAEAADEADAEKDVEFFEGADHLMIVSGGGVSYSEYAELLPPDSPWVQSAEAVDSGYSAESPEEDGEVDDGNVILFSEKFPVFSGVRADDLDGSDDEMCAGTGQLRMLPYENAEENAQTAQDGVVIVNDFSGVHDVVEEDAPKIDARSDVFMAPACADSTLPDSSGEIDRTDEAVCAVDEQACRDSESEPAAIAPAAVEGVSGVLAEADKGVLARALYGLADDFWFESEAEDAGALHAIVAEEPEGELPGGENAVRAEIEAEYQERLDEFASRLLQAQAAQAAEAEKVSQKQIELEARTAIIEEMQKRLDAEEMRIGEISGKLAETNSKLDEKDREIKSRDKERELLSQIREEHGRLYKEFEDLRSGYNEIVTTVLPGLQGERDDLAMTVERQCEEGATMRSALGSVRKRLAVGYSLAGAACLALCALPVAYWIQSGKADREMAVGRQKLAELHETLQREVQGNIAARNTIIELENKVGTARDQLGDLQRKNQELARLSRVRQAQPVAPAGMERQSQDVAVFKPSPSPSEGTPVRASDMALQATGQADGRLHVNQVRDPSGSIEELAFQNRRTQQGQDMKQLADNGSPAQRPVALSVVSIPSGPSGAVESNGLRPSGPVPVVRPLSLPPPVRQGTPRDLSRPSGAGNGELVAKVKKGEGVAQVVYRTLGTWDSEVIAWVVKENNLTLDKKGNPRIHPDQELRLPRDLRSLQSASAGRKR